MRFKLLPDAQLDDSRSTRAAIDGLVSGAAEPSLKAAKVAAAKKAPAARAPKPKIGDLLESKVHSGAPVNKAATAGRK